jgi:ribulose-bisphosphate carboxylase large chain
VGVSYRLFGKQHEVEALARKIAFEQSVELPEAQVPDQIRQQVVGRVEEVSADLEIEGARRATISYPARHAGTHLSQLLNLIYGNVSIYARVRLMDISLPQGLVEGFRGPRFGIQGLRALSGVFGRPLLATALKPKGASAETLASIAADFALGGGDIVKDDQNLADDFETFKHRVEACARAVDEANAQTGRRCLYLPHLAAPAGELDHYLDYVAELGLRGVLLCPMIIGLETTRNIATRYPLVLVSARGRRHFHLPQLRRTLFIHPGGMPFHQRASARTDGGCGSRMALARRRHGDRESGHHGGGLRGRCGVSCWGSAVRPRSLAARWHPRVHGRHSRTL